MFDKRLSHTLFLILVFYVFGDIITTYYGIQLGHVEYNPFMNPLISVWGMKIIVLIKILFFIALIYINKYLASINQIIAAKCLNGIILVMGIFLTMSNTLVIFTGYNIFQHIGLM